MVKLKRELNATSSQDEFAKWAKLRRAHDKKMADYDEKSTLNNTGPFRIQEICISIFIYIYTLLANGLKSFRLSFDRTVTLTRFLSTNGLRLFLQFWYAKHPMYWIPRGWVPGYIEWILAFPRAPSGSVSIQIWGIACATVVQILGAAVVAGLVLASEGLMQKKKGRAGSREPVQVGQ